MLDLGDDRDVIASGDGFAQRQERAVNPAQQRAMILRLAALRHDCALQVVDRLLALDRACSKQLRIVLVVDLFGRLFIALDAVDQSGDQGVERGGVFGVV